MSQNVRGGDTTDVLGHKSINSTGAVPTATDDVIKLQEKINNQKMKCVSCLIGL